MATVSTIDFYQKHFRKDESPEHYLKVSRLFTAMWAVLIIVPAIMYAQSEGSILQTLSKIGAYFVGANLSMHALGFFSKHTTERGVLVGVVAGFIMVWYVATQTDIAWPWFCLIGATVNIVVSVSTSLIIDGRQKSYSPYSIRGQIEKFRNENLASKDGDWYLLAGKVDKVSYLLLAFFVATLLFLFLFERLI
jgi:SSS family solute:Na+ symporter